MTHEVRKATRRFVTLCEEGQAKATKLEELHQSPIAYIDPHIQGEIVAYEAMVAWLYDEIQTAERDLQQLREKE